MAQRARIPHVGNAHVAVFFCCGGAAAPPCGATDRIQGVAAAAGDSIQYLLIFRCARSLGDGVMCRDLDPGSDVLTLKFGGFEGLNDSCFQEGNALFC